MYIKCSVSNIVIAIIIIITIVLIKLTIYYIIAESIPIYSLYVIIESCNHFNII